MWGNYLYHKLENKNLLLVPDSGIFYSNLDFQPDMINLRSDKVNYGFPFNLPTE